MKRLKIVVVVSILTIVLLSSCVVFAERAIGDTSNNGVKQFAQKFTKTDPVQMLEKAKADIQQKLTDGKITQAQADTMTAKIDKQITEIQDFNKLTTDQKKDKLLNDFTTSINQKVTDGKMTRDQADKAIADYKTKLESWDGTGYPFSMGRGMKGFGFGSAMDKNGAGTQNRLENGLDKAVQDGVITQQQKDSLMQYFKN